MMNYVDTGAGTLVLSKKIRRNSIQIQVHAIEHLILSINIRRMDIFPVIAFCVFYLAKAALYSPRFI